MGKTNQRLAGIIIWFLIIVLGGNIGLLSRFFSSGNAGSEPITEDSYMTTQRYNTTIEIESDNSYRIEEKISVFFDSERHGIYRYIPCKGVITQVTPEGEQQDIPYYADIQEVQCSEPFKQYSENFNQVFQIGSEDVTVSGEKEYSVLYHITPITSKGYTNVYYNVFPKGWRNEIPAGSTFTVVFPDEVDRDALRLYYGSYGQQNDGMDLVKLDWSGDTVTGTLTESLPVGSGMTFYMAVPDGYFQNVHTIWNFNFIYIVVSLAILIAVLILFFLFGRDKAIIPSVQFAPPHGLDSAAVGCIIDGSISNEDLISLFLFWADKGYLKIRETDSQALAFIKLRDLPDNTPRYARILFDKVFGTGGDSLNKEVKVSSLKYRMADTFATSKELLHMQYHKQLYTKSSRIMRWVSFFAALIPVLYFIALMYTVAAINGLVYLFLAFYAIGLFIFCMTVDYWYSRTRRRRILFGSAGAGLCIIPAMVMFVVYGIPMLNGSIINLFPAMLCYAVVSVTCMVLVGFMKKRTNQCIEWMGYLTGLRDFIETAELERMQVIAQESPQLFYHILPYAYVFGLSGILLDKMKDLTIPAPDWYESPSRTPYFDFYLMHHILYTSMPQLTTTIVTPKPEQSSYGSVGGSGGGGFSGGGFSGGGFGGGGGGSW